MTITFKNGKLPLRNVPMTEANRRQYEKIMGSEILEFIPDDKTSTSTHNLAKVETPKAEVFTKTVEVETPISNVSMVKHFAAQGKTALSIAKYLDMTKDEVEIILNQK